MRVFLLILRMRDRVVAGPSHHATKEMWRSCSVRILLKILTLPNITEYQTNTTISLSVCKYYIFPANKPNVAKKQHSFDHKMIVCILDAATCDADESVK